MPTTSSNYLTLLDMVPNWSRNQIICREEEGSGYRPTFKLFLWNAIRHWLLAISNDSTHTFSTDLLGAPLNLVGVMQNSTVICVSQSLATVKALKKPISVMPFVGEPNCFSLKWCQMISVYQYNVCLPAYRTSPYPPCNHCGGLLCIYDDIYWLWSTDIIIVNYAE